LDLQSYLALGVVALTVAAFTYRLFRPKKKSGCGKSCGCGREEKSKVPKGRP
jgi:hypothetical protein